MHFGGSLGYIPSLSYPNVSFTQRTVLCTEVTFHNDLVACAHKSRTRTSRSHAQPWQRGISHVACQNHRGHTNVNKSDMSHMRSACVTTSRKIPSCIIMGLVRIYGSFALSHFLATSILQLPCTSWIQSIMVIYVHGMQYHICILLFFTFLITQLALYLYNQQSASKLSNI